MIFLQGMCQWLGNTLLNAMQMKTAKGQDDSHSYVLTGVALAYIAHSLKLVKHLKESEFEHMAEFLLLHSDGKSCTDYDILVKSIPQDEFKLVT